MNIQSFKRSHNSISGSHIWTIALESRNQENAREFNPMTCFEIPVLQQDKTTRYCYVSWSSLLPMSPCCFICGISLWNHYTALLNSVAKALLLPWMFRLSPKVEWYILPAVEKRLAYFFFFRTAFWHASFLRRIWYIPVRPRRHFDNPSRLK